MVLLLTAEANVSPQIEREVERAVHRRVPIVPVRIEEVLPGEALEYFLSAPHWLDAFAPPLGQHLDRLAAAVRTALESRPLVKEPAVEEEESPPSASEAEPEVEQESAVVEVEDEPILETEDAPETEEEMPSPRVATPYVKEEQDEPELERSAEISEAVVAVVVAAASTGHAVLPPPVTVPEPAT